MIAMTPMIPMILTLLLMMLMLQLRVTSRGFVSAASVLKARLWLLAAPAHSASAKMMIRSITQFFINDDGELFYTGGDTGDADTSPPENLNIRVIETLTHDYADQPGGGDVVQLNVDATGDLKMLIAAASTIPAVRSPGLRMWPRLRRLNPSPR